MKKTVRLFMPQRRSHYVTKPLLTLSAFISVFLIADYAVHREFSFASPYYVLMIAAVQAPFMALAFALVMYLDHTQRKLVDLAMTDVLTGLPNRRRFMDTASQALDNRTPGYLLILDADHFKLINDTYGHAIGDICLEAISERLSQMQEPNDLIGRIGGEEFGAFLPDRAEKDIVRLEHHLTQKFTIDTPQLKKALSFTMSIGAAEVNTDEDLPSLMRRADEALYEAKTMGRSRLILWRKFVAENRALRAG